METSDNLSSTLYPPTTTSSTITQPLIPSTSSDQDDPQYLDQISFNQNPHRPFKDLPFLLLFLFLNLSTISLGIFAIINQNPHRHNLPSFSYNPTTSSCSLVQNPPQRSNLYPQSFNLYSQRFNFYSQSFNFYDNYYLSFVEKYGDGSGTIVRSLIWTSVITLVLSVPFVLFVLLLLKHYTKQLVYASLPFFVIVPVFVNVYWFVACTLSSRCGEVFPIGYRIVVLVFVFLIIGVVVWIFVANWGRIELTVRIIGVASDALSRNLGLFGVLPCLVLGLFVYYVPVVVFLVFASSNGKIVPREEEGEWVCVWKQDRWVPAYYALTILTMLWSAAVMVEAQVYVISGTIAQWYFSKDELGPPKSGIRNSLRNAFSSSSGTICFSGLLICIVRMLRAMVDNAREEDASGIVNLILRCCVNTFLSAVDFLNKFTINFAAITGEAYCSAARMTYELLRRNLLSAVFVETVSTRILAGIIFVLSAIYAIVVCVILKAVIHLGDDSYFVAVMAWVLLIIVLGYFVHILDNVIDTVYICYAIDRDRGEVFKQDVHDVYAHLPISRSHRAGYVARTPLLV